MSVNVALRIMKCIELNWLCKHMKKVRSNQAAMFILNWVKLSFSLWKSKKCFECFPLLFQKQQHFLWTNFFSVTYYHKNNCEPKFPQQLVSYSHSSSLYTSPHFWFSILQKVVLSLLDLKPLKDSIHAK